MLYFVFHDEISLDALAGREEQIQNYYRAHPLLVPGIAFLIYTAAIAFSVPIAAILSLAMAWFFGFWLALVLVSFASTSGSTLAFLFSRYLFRDSLRDWLGERLETFNRRLEDEGAFYLFTLRLIVGVPPFVINLGMGLTPIRVTTFWWVSQLGMLPGTILFVYAGSRFPSLREIAESGASGIFTWDVILGFTVLGLFPLAMKKLLGRGKPAEQTADVHESEEM